MGIVLRLWDAGNEKEKSAGTWWRKVLGLSQSKRLRSLRVQGWCGGFTRSRNKDDICIRIRLGSVVGSGSTIKAMVMMTTCGRPCGCGCDRTENNEGAG